MLKFDMRRKNSSGSAAAHGKSPGRDKRSSAKCGFDSTSDRCEPVATAVDPKLNIGRLVLV